MNNEERDKLAKWISILREILDGKTLQVNIGVIGGPPKWKDLPNPSEFSKLDFDPSWYRIKPEPREFWAVMQGGKILACYSQQGCAKAQALYEADHSGGNFNVVKLREVCE